MTTVTLAPTSTANGASRAARSSSAPTEADGGATDFESVMAGQSTHAESRAPRPERSTAPRPAAESAAPETGDAPSESAAPPTTPTVIQTASPSPEAVTVLLAEPAGDPAEPADADDETPVEAEDPTLLAAPVIVAPEPVPPAIPPAATQAYGLTPAPKDPATPAVQEAPGQIGAPNAAVTAPAGLAAEDQVPPPSADPATPTPGADAIRVDAPPTQNLAKMDTSSTAEAGASRPAPPPVVETQRQLAVHIGKAAQAGESTLTINLSPIALGPVAVRLFFHAGGVDLQLTVAQKTTYDSLVLDQSGLEQQLAQAGVNITGGGVDLRFGAPDGGAPQGHAAPAFSGQSGRGPQGPMAESVEHVLLPGQGLLNIIA